MKTSSIRILEYLNRNVKRHLRFNHPTKLFEDPSFEVDDEGHPYYIATTYENVFWFKQLEPTGLIVLDAVTGETEEYDLDSMPEWADRVYSANLIMQQLNYRGQYSSRLLQCALWPTWCNCKRQMAITIFQWITIFISILESLPSTMMPLISDFILSICARKQLIITRSLQLDEVSAMESAEGSLQQMRFESTFPLLISLNDRPYYISSLKDDSGLVRSYALVDAQDYQKVITSDTVDGLITQLNGQTITDSDDAEEDIVDVVDENVTEVSGQVENISQAVVSGNTIYYFMIDGSIYKADIELHDGLPFVEEGQVVEGEANENNEFKVIILD
ncbi:MAG: hypothetical protein U5K84_09910 [Alkalibacterium sp.]|nr:hypothetical protein [Alkalibacterium sp.]